MRAILTLTATIGIVVELDETHFAALRDTPPSEASNIFSDAFGETFSEVQARIVEQIDKHGSTTIVRASVTDVMRVK